MHRMFIKGNPTRLRHCVKLYGPEGRLFSSENLVFDDPNSQQNANGSPLFNLWSGIHSYGTAFSPNAALFDKTDMSFGIELEFSFTSTRTREVAMDPLTSNWFILKRDGSLPENGAELVTIPLPGKIATDPKLWIGLNTYLKPFANARDIRSCGLHVHIGSDYFRYKSEGAAQNFRLMEIVAAYIHNVIMVEPKLSVVSSLINGRTGTHYSRVLRLSIKASEANDNNKEAQKTLKESLSVCFPSRLIASPSTQAEKINEKKLRATINTIFRITDNTSYGTNKKQDEPLEDSLMLTLFSDGKSIMRERYNTVNLCHMNKTIEFRSGKASLNPWDLHLFVCYIHDLCRFTTKICSNRNPAHLLADGNKLIKAFFDFVKNNTRSHRLKAIAEGVLKGGDGITVDFTDAIFYETRFFNKWVGQIRLPVPVPDKEAWRKVKYVRHSLRSQTRLP